MNGFISEHWSGLLALFLGLLLFIWFIKRRKRLNNNFEIDEEIIILPQTNYTLNTNLTTEENFIAYVCNYAEAQNIPRTEQDVMNFTLERFEQLRLGYVMDTNKPLFLNNVPKTIGAIAKKYVSKENN